MKLITLLKKRRLIDALRNENWQKAMHYIRQGTDVNTVDPINGWTPLMYAVFYGRVDEAQQIVTSLKPDLNKADRRGLTPAMRAMMSHENNILKILLDRGKIKIEIPDNDGMTILDWGVQNGNVKGISYILNSRYYNIASSKLDALIQKAYHCRHEEGDRQARFRIVHMLIKRRRDPLARMRYTMDPMVKRLSSVMNVLMKE